MAGAERCFIPTEKTWRLEEATERIVRESIENASQVESRLANPLVGNSGGIVTIVTHGY